MEKDKAHESQHITPYSTYILIWVALIALTSITVSVAGIDLGIVAIGVALLIATIKSTLVVNIFMHIKFEEPIFKVFIFISLITLIVIFILTFFDILSR